MRFRRSLLAAAALGSFLLVGAAQAATLRVGIQDDPDALDPAVERHLYRPLRLCRDVRQARRHRARPRDRSAARRRAGNSADDQKAVTFTLRTGVKFHDGTPLRCRGRQVQHRAHADDEGLAPESRAFGGRQRRRPRLPTRSA